MSSADPFMSIEAERTVLGCVLGDPALFAAARQLIEIDHFVRSSHRQLWKALERVDKRDETISLIALLSELESTPSDRPGESMLDVCGGQRGVVELEKQRVSVGLEFEPAVRVLQERRARRELQRTFEDSLQSLQVGSDCVDVLRKLNDRTAKIQTQQFDDSESYASTIAQRVTEDLESGETQLRYLPTGNALADRLLGGGISPGLSYIVGALSGHGKTTFTSSLVAGLLRNNNNVFVDWYGCEVPPKWQFCRIASSYGDVPETFWRTNHQQEIGGVYRRAIKALGWGTELHDRLRIWHCKPRISVAEVALNTVLRRRAIGPKSDLIVVVDYIQRASGAGGETPGDRIARASEALAGLCDEHTATLGLTQFTTEKHKDEPIPIPKPEETRWSKDIHQDACDLLIYHRPHLEKEPPLCTVQLAKSRYGRLAHAWFWGTPSNRFVPYDEVPLQLEQDLQAIHGIDVNDHRVPFVKGLHTGRLT